MQTVITSPPYWSLRDYSAEGQIGRDDALGEYVKSIVMALDQVRRVLTDDGTVWLNVGDSYTSGNRRYRAPDRKNRDRAMSVRPPTPEGLKPKDLIGVPWRLAFALQDAGWWLRSEVIWYKPNAHPESVSDRPTKSHETVFLLSKNQDYYYDTAAVKGPNGCRLRTMWDIIRDHPHRRPRTRPQLGRNRSQPHVCRPHGATSRLRSRMAAQPGLTRPTPAQVLELGL
ncbi:DNA-methyltransferase [Candidatus Poriferisocius sp.]|uniref:DNA-methyltransferase n=1 Tax=Candidatus Poriferisocius sp. TaxID=3101276 RepID=UPI003B0207A8